MTQSASQTTVKKVFSEDFKKEIKLIPANSVKIEYNLYAVSEKTQLIMAAVSALILVGMSIKFIL